MTEPPEPPEPAESAEFAPNTSSPDWRGESLEQTRVRLRRAWGDYPLTILVFNPINLRLARWLGPTSVTPNQLTMVSFVLMLAASAGLACPTWPVQAAGGLLLWLSYLIDCLDGDLARYKGLKSPLGAMLDPMLDRFGEVVLGAAVAVCGWQSTGEAVWLVGGLALVGFSQVYFYLVDVLVKRLPSKPPSAGRTLRGTRLRLGAIEPWLWGQAALGLLGVAHLGVPVFGAMFALGCVGQAVRIVRAAGTDAEAGSERYGTHLHRDQGAGAEAEVD